MYQSTRAKLGSSITQSPYEKTKSWIQTNLTGIFFGVLICILWLAVLYVVSGIIVFFGGHFYLNLWDEDKITAADIYAKPWMEMVKICGIFVILFIVFHGLQKKR